MREMKDSGIEWIGEIPDDWRIIRNKNAFTCSKELVGEKSELTQLLSLTTRGIKKKDINNAEGKLPESFDTYQFVKENDLVMCLFDLDCSAVFSGISPYNGMISPAYRVLSCKKCMEPKYADYWFQYISDGRKFNHYAKNIRYTLSYEEFSALPLLLPERNEQRRIADYLDRKCGQIDAIIARQQEVIEKLKDYKLSIITEAVTKGLNPDVPMKDSGVEWIGEIPDFWNVVPLKTCSDILPGYAFSSNDFDTENGTALLRGINVTPNGVRWEDVVYWNKPITEQLRAFELVAGDIVVGLDRPWVSGGTRVCWVTQKDLPALLLQRVCRIRAKENIDSRWIYHWIASKSFQEALSIETTGVSVPHISTKQIGQFSITLPPIEVQHQICDTLETKCYSIDKIADKKQAIIDKLTEYKKSLIYEDVTGKKEV